LGGERALRGLRTNPLHPGPARSILHFAEGPGRARGKGSKLDFVFRFVDEQRIVMLHNAKPPPDDAWNEYLRVLAERDVTQQGLLVVTAGGAPNAAQRQGLNQVLKGRPFARAIVHDSVIVRGVVSAVSWFAPGVEAFSPAALQKASVHAKFQPGEFLRVQRILGELHEQLSPPIPWFANMIDPKKQAAAS
jgi:hypothetical protein